MNDGELALFFLVIGLALAVPTACWFGIRIGEERAIQRVMKATRPYSEQLRRDWEAGRIPEIDEDRNPGGQAWGPWA